MNSVTQNKDIVWYKTYNGEVLVPGRIYNIQGKFWAYAGDFKDSKDVEMFPCCYTIGDELRIKNVVFNTNVVKERPKRKKRTDDDRPIDLSIKDTDNSLMVLIKTALSYKKITRGDFKQMYNNDSDMNNALRCIESGDNLSWARFTDLAQRLNISYNLKIYDKDDAIEEIVEKYNNV